MTVRIAGSLWSVPRSDIRTEADRLVAAGLRVWHWDRADGSLGPAGGFSAAEAGEISAATGIRSEAHLMLADPRPELDAWTEFAELVVVHVESAHWRQSLDMIRARGARAGIAISPASTLPEDLDADVAVLVMTVAPGNAGAGFLAQQLTLLPRISHHPLRGVDGSVDLDRGREARSLGANWLVSGTALTTAADPGSWMRCLSASQPASPPAGR